MKSTSRQKNISDRRAKSDELRPEYRFDYSESEPNRFAGRPTSQVVVVLDPDVARVFTDPVSVNTALRALLSAIPRTRSATRK